MSVIGRTLLVATLLAALAPLSECAFKLTLLHTNDMHARFQETNAHSGQCLVGKGKCYGGFARLKTAVEQLKEEARQQGRASLFLNAGDTYQGTVFYSIFKYNITLELMNMMDIDVMSLGNHEFDDGPAGLAPFLDNSTTPVVCCNIDYSQEPALANLQPSKLAPSVVLDVQGVKVGVIGYLTPDTKFLSRTGAVVLHDEVTAIKKEAARLKEQGVNILIAVGHSGFPKDKEIAREVQDLDLVVGGHTNTFLYNGMVNDLELPEGPYPTVVKQPSGREVLVIQAYAYTKYLGHLDVDFDDGGEVVKFNGNPILVDDSFRKDEAMDRVVLKYENEIFNQGMTRHIGQTKVFLEADSFSCRTRECNFGNFVTDAIVNMNTEDFIGEGWTNAPVAFVQGGGLRSSISNEHAGGAISSLDLLTTMPFENTIDRLTLKGSTLKEVLEHSVSRYSTEDRAGGFLHFSGMQVTYNVSRPPGTRVVTALVRCGDCPVPMYSPLDSTKDYHVLTTTYLSNGGDGYNMLKEVQNKTYLSFGDRYAVEAYLSRMSPVYPELSGRIRVLAAPPRDTSTANSLMRNRMPLALLSTLLLHAARHLLG